MLTAYQIDVLRDQSAQLLDPIIEYLIEDIARRVSEAGQLTSTVAYQVWRAQNLGVSQRKLKKELQKRLNISLQDVEKLLTQAAKTGYNFDISRLPTHQAIPFSANSNLQQILDATVKMAQDDLTNIVQTIGFVCPDGEERSLTKAYHSACDFAFNQVTTGARDFVSAVREATKGLAEKGILSIDYEAGVHTSIEAAVRRNIMGGLGLMQEKISQQNHDALGCDGWEISAHAGSAPDHEPIQGRQYTDAEYTSLNNSLVRRIGTLNCGHSASPILYGLTEPQYTDQDLEQFRLDNETGVTYGDKHYTLYEATQRQRALERAVRKQKRRILIDEAAGDEDRLRQDRVKLVRLREEYNRFSKDTGLRTQYERMETAGFTWKHGKAAERAAKTASSITAKKVEIPEKHDTISVGENENTVKNGEVAGVHYVTRLDIDKYKCVSENITTDEVIMTDERIQHIRDRHPNDFERYEKYIREIIENPDFILEANKPNTAFLLKRIQEGNERFELILRLAVQGDPEGYKNSVITFLKVEEKRYNRYLRTKKILYKAE